MLIYLFSFEQIKSYIGYHLMKNISRKDEEKNLFTYKHVSLYQLYVLQASLRRTSCFDMRHKPFLS